MVEFEDNNRFFFFLNRQVWRMFQVWWVLGYIQAVKNAIILFPKTIGTLQVKTCSDPNQETQWQIRKHNNKTENTTANWTGPSFEPERHGLHGWTSTIRDGSCRVPTFYGLVNVVVFSDLPLWFALQGHCTSKCQDGKLKGKYLQ